MKTDQPEFLVIPSSREEVFVASPIVVYSIRLSEPTLPAITGPVFRPTPIRKPSCRPAARTSLLNASSAGPTISRAAASARSAWSGWSIGAPNTAMIPSPM